ncbi:maker446 [Drosophila busckii]|uniref:Maker446 n=1 Tax=Drosophila busckii TaxID=30019 RepID=A0A0M4E9L2_DROBS|nr:variant surface antigen E [Drosophila busckii]ALC38914.1 maker446 [Drosophila busckii]
MRLLCLLLLTLCACASYWPVNALECYECIGDACNELTDDKLVSCNLDNDDQGKTTTGSPDSTTDAATTESGPTESGPTETTAKESEPTETTAKESEPTDTTANESEPTDTTPTESEPTDTTPKESEPTEITATESESTASDSTASDSTASESTATEPTTTEPTTTEPSTPASTESSTLADTDTTATESATTPTVSTETEPTEITTTVEPTITTEEENVAPTDSSRIVEAVRSGRARRSLAALATDQLLNNYRSYELYGRAVEYRTSACYKILVNGVMQRGCIRVPEEQSACQAVRIKVGLPEGSTGDDECDVCQMDRCNGSASLRISLGSLLLLLGLGLRSLF